MLRADHIMIRTTNLKKSENFYSIVMKMEVVARDNRMDNETNKYDSIFMECTESKMKLELVYNDGKDNIGDYVVGNTFDHFAFYTDEIEDVYLRAIGMGALTNEVIIHDVGEKIYTIGGIVSPEGIKIGLVQKVLK